MELQETVAVPDPMMLDGVILPQARPEDGASLRLTVPVNPFNALTVIVEVADDPTVTGGEEAVEIEKSAMAKVTIAV